MVAQTWACHPFRFGLVWIVLIASIASATEPEGPSLAWLKSARAKLVPLHSKMGPRQPGDWLESHPEPGQSFEQYLGAQPVTPTGRRRVIYVIPVGEFSPKQQEIVKLTAEYLSLCYNRPVKSLPAFPLDQVPDKAQRKRPGAIAPEPPPADEESPIFENLPVPLTDRPKAPPRKPGDTQLLTTWMLDDLLPKRLPKDGAALIALTASDLWPGPGWNFVFGQASLKNRVGVWSIHRNGDPARDDDHYRLCLLRTLKTASHELGHMFTIEHCTAYECNMCGSNNRDEADRRPLAFCPQCSAKIWWATQTDPEQHFRKLAEYCERNKLTDQTRFYKDSAAALTRK